MTFQLAKLWEARGVDWRINEPSQRVFGGTLTPKRAPRASGFNWTDSEAVLDIAQANFSYMGILARPVSSLEHRPTAH